MKNADANCSPRTKGVTMATWRILIMRHDVINEHKSQNFHLITDNFLGNNQGLIPNKPIQVFPVYVIAPPTNTRKGFSSYSGVLLIIEEPHRLESTSQHVKPVHDTTVQTSS